MGKKALAGAAWGRLGLASLSLRLGVNGLHRLLVLAYHRVLDIGDEATFPGDPELVSASVDGFRRQMAFVRENFVPLRMADVVRALHTGLPLPRRALLVTFDDGHQDNFQHAFPILRGLGIPATIFLSTGYIDAPGKTFWFDRVAQLIHFGPEGKLNLDAGGYSAELNDMRSRRRACQTWLRQLKREPQARRLAVLDEMECRLGHCVPHEVTTQRASLNWAEVREMSAAGIEFGSHTVTHPILARLDEDGIASELAASRESITRQTGRPAVAVAYPVGKADAFDDRVVSAAKACGYRLGLTYESGVNPWPPHDPFRLLRLPVERYTGLGQFKAVLSQPELFAD